MVQLYDTYTTASFSALIEKTDMTKYGDIVPFETAQIDGKLIVPFEMAQIPNVLFATGWTNHQIILNRCKSDTERLNNGVVFSPKNEHRVHRLTNICYLAHEAGFIGSRTYVH